MTWRGALAIGFVVVVGCRETTCTGESTTTIDGPDLCDNAYQGGVGGGWTVPITSEQLDLACFCGQPELCPWSDGGSGGSAGAGGAP